jgi:hypothetical protein
MRLLTFPFRAEDAYRIDPQDAQPVEGYALPEELATTQAITLALDGTKKPLACFGRVPTPYGWEIWTILSVDAAGHLIRLTRKARELLGMCEGHVTAFVREDFAEGHRWAKLLGFEQKAGLFGFMPHGEDAAVYVRTN